MEAKQKLIKFAVQIQEFSEAEVLRAIELARLREKQESKKQRAKVLLEMLLKLKEAFPDRHFQTVIEEAIRKTENLKIKPDEILKKIEAAVLAEAHTYEEISEDASIPLDVVRRFVGVLVKNGTLLIKKRLVPSTNNFAHLIYHKSQEGEL